jgi:glutamyl/glutaminyl-tRNA synthetase
MKIFDWLDVQFDFEPKYQKKIFQSQREDDYTKWLKLLIGQRDAYKCFCKNYLKCEKHCFDSRENMEIENQDFRANKDVMYVRFKNNNVEYKYYDYMEYEDKFFNSDNLGDFLLFKNFNNQFTEIFKRVVDDDIFSVTHIIEDKVKSYLIIIRKLSILLKMPY